VSFCKNRTLYELFAMLVCTSFFNFTFTLRSNLFVETKTVYFELSKKKIFQNLKVVVFCFFCGFIMAIKRCMTIIAL